MPRKPDKLVERIAEALVGVPEPWFLSEFIADRATMDRITIKDVRRIARALRKAGMVRP